MDKIKSLIERIEGSDIGFGIWISTALGIIFIRDFLENVVSFNTVDMVNSFHFIHFPVFFISSLLAIIILLHFFSKVEIAGVSKVCLIFFGVILLPLVIDSLIALFFHEDISYLYIVKNLRFNFLNFLNPFIKTPDVPYGIRAEIAAISALSFSYIFIKRKKVLLSLLGAFFAFLICFFFISIPGLLIESAKFIYGPIFKLKVSAAAVYDAFTEGAPAQKRVTIVELLITSFLAALWLWRYDRIKFIGLARNLRFSRLLHYFLLLIAGMMFYYSFTLNLSGSPEYFSVIRAAGILAAVFFAFQFSVITNDIYDIETDKISNKDRPLASGAISKAAYLNVAFANLALALLFAFNVADITFMIIILFISLYFIYSVPPLRLKRFFPVSSAIIAAEAVLAFFMGFSFPENIQVLAQIQITPTLWVLFFVFFLSSSLKDLKDIEGDRVSGVYTIPVILGETKARKVIGFCICVSYLAISLYLNKFFVILTATFLSVTALFFGIYSYFYIVREDAQEKVIFSVYFVYVCFIIICLVTQILMLKLLLRLS